MPHHESLLICATQATMFHCMDRLGIAQYLSRIGLALDGNQGTSLVEGKERWINDPMWQGVRRVVEDTMVVKDWFETFVAQNLVVDGLLYPLVYRHIRAAEWFRSGQPFTPDFDASLGENGLGHKAVIRFRTPGLNGLNGSRS